MLAMLSLFLMVMGAICITMSLSKEILFFLKPASFCFILSGQWRQQREETVIVLTLKLCVQREAARKDANPFLSTVPSAGVLVLLCLVVFHQSVLALLASDHTIPLHHELSWSVSCVGCAGAVLIVGGILFLLLALPYRPWQRCLPQKNSS